MNRHTRATLWAISDRLAPYTPTAVVALASAALGVLLTLWSFPA